MTGEQNPSRHRSLVFRPHVLLLVVIAVELAAAAALHRSAAELKSDLASGTPEQKVGAIFVLTNRGLPEKPDETLTRRLLASDEELIREWTMTANFVRRPIPAPVQSAYIASLGGSAEAERCEFLLRFRPGLGHNITLATLRSFLEATSRRR